jgi:hypothetical protein
MEPVLDELELLAKESSRERRATLLRQLTDVFFQSSRGHDAHVVQLFEDVICRVMDDVDVKARVELAERMAFAPDAPHGVVAKLARDLLPVAEPVLRHSPALTEADLKDIVAATGDAHRAVVSRRIYVSEAVTDVLLECGDAEVRRALAGNEGAQITAPGYQRLLDRARGDKVLQELMALRGNLPQTVRSALMPLLAAEVRRRVMGRVMEGAKPLIDRALDRELEAILERVEGLTRDRSVYEELQAAFDEGTISLDEALQQACRSDRHDWLVELLSFIGPLDRSRVVQTLLERDPKPIAVLLKAHDAAPETFRAVLDMRAKHLRIGSNSPQLVADYTKLATETAHAVLRHLRLRIAAA